MKVKEVQRTANIAWSPAPQYPIYLAAGTAAQQLDATFSTSAALEIFSLNLSNSDVEMPLQGTLSSEHRFHKLIWGSYGMDTSSLSSSAGILVGGSDNGLITLYDANKIILEDEEPEVFKTTKHTGPVQALDFNPFQSSLLASGASDSEIYIWDLNKPTTPLSPGTKTLPPDNISCVSWNRQVQHILASTSPCGRCVVWDLRKNEPIIKVSDQSALIRCKAVEWHPDVATQMVLASEDDRYPVIQMWDLRFATSPMKVLEGHQRGILSIAWCPQDPDLLMSCAKDNRILCWNPNVQGPGGEIVYELPTTAQWSFDVAWCPRNPAMICSSSFDGHVSVFSLMGGSVSGQDLNQQKVMSAFDVDDPFGSQLHQAQQQQQKKALPTSAPLKKPPKWLRRPCGASFAFGGKLISFGQSRDSPSSQVNISQVTTEQELVNRSYELEGALASGSFIQYCGSKVENTSDELERTLWSFLKTNFEREPRRHFLTLLGYDPMQLSKKVASSYISSGPSGARGGVDAEELVQKMQLLTSGEAGRKSGEGVFSSGASTPSVTGSKTPLSDAGSLSEGAAAFDAIASGGPLTIDTNADFGVTEPTKPSLPFKIPTDNDTDGLITQALLTGNFEAAVDVCLHADRMADAFLLAIAGGPDLLTRIQTSYFERSKSNVARLMSVVVNRDWRDIVESCVLENWREALAALVTYAKAEEFTSLCDVLGQRLEQEGDAHCANAMVCYICAGNVEKFVSCWSRNMPVEPSPLALQELIEKVMVLKKAVERERRLVIDSGSSVLAEKLSKYSEILAAQGCLETAMGYLMASSDQASLGVLKDRLFNAQHPSHLTTSTAPPPFPFQRVDVLAEPLPQSQFTQQPAYSFPQQQQQQQPQHYQPQPQRPPTHLPAVSTYQPTLPPQQPQFYNPTTYQPPAPTVPQPSYSQVTPSQPPYYTGPSQPPAAATQSSWSQPPPVPMYQPQLANPVSSQGPSPGQYGSAMQMGGQSQPVQIYNPAASVTPGAPHSGPGAVGVPPVGPPPQGPIAPPPTTGPPPTEPPPLSGAWKDTHIMRGKKQQTQAYTPPAPITTPLFGVGDPSYQRPPQQQPSPVAMPQGVPLSHGGRPMVLQGGGPPGAPPSYGDAPSQQLPQVYDGSPPPSPHQLTMPYQTHLPPAQEPAQPIIKSPIPAEHLVLQETFDGLVQRCKSTANNPLTKRKLEEVSKRLEALYDKLRDQKMSVPILEGLHEIATACQNVDYPRGLMAHTSLISSGSFSEISTFMPGLKSLMQIATQLRV